MVDELNVVCPACGHVRTTGARGRTRITCPNCGQLFAAGQAALAKAPPPPPPPPAKAATEEAPVVDADKVRRLLRGVGGALGFVIGDDDVPNHWHFTDAELDDLVPPLTDLINRRVELRRAVARGDELTIALVLARYAGRNVN